MKVVGSGAMSDLSPEFLPAALAALGYASNEPVETLRLGGGAIQDNVLLSFPEKQSRKVVLRADAPSTLSVSLSRAAEHRVLDAVFAAGVTVPEPLAFVKATDAHPAFSLMAFCPGIALGKRVVADPVLSDARKGLAARLGCEFAAIHSVLPNALAGVLAPPPANPALDRVNSYEAALVQVTRPSPVLAFALRWLRQNARLSGKICLLHRDLRTGNYLLAPEGLVAILDWEFAAFGDPLEDLGWFLCADWRFGRDDLEAGGIGSRLDFLDAYREASRLNFDSDDIRYWEVMASVRWALIALEQGQRALKENSLELALVGRRIQEIETNILARLEEASDHAA